MALASQFKLVSNDNTHTARRQPRVRFDQIVDMAGGETVGVAALTDQSFEEQAFFGFAQGTEAACPAAWLGDVVERTARAATMRGLSDRPIAILAPDAALAHPDAPMAAEAGAARANACPQEFRLEFSDAALQDEEFNGLDSLYRFYRRGFRVGVDARRSWRSPFDDGMRLIVEAVRFDANTLRDLGAHDDRFDAACGSEVFMYAENAAWRDNTTLGRFGVGYAIAPRLDG